MEMARSMLFEKNLPKKFWAEAVHTTIYLLNGLPTRAVEDKTPVEAWFGLKPSAYHLKVFGSICYMHVPTTRRTKLDEKAEMGILVGYAAQSKGYRIYNLQSQKVEVHRNVLVDESAFWSWDDQKIIKESYSQLNEDSNVEQSASAIPRHQNVVETDDDSPPLKVKSLEDVYARYNLVTFDPTCFFEASKHDEWMAAMKEELAMIEKNKTWSLCPRPEGKNVIGVKGVFRTKLNPDGLVNKYKAKLVIKGYAQQQGVDFSETFAPVVRHDTIKLLFAISAQNDWKVYHMDVKSAFLNGFLEEEIYIEQSEGFLVHGSEDMVYKLHKALYGMKQAPRAWYSRIDAYLMQQGSDVQTMEHFMLVMKKEFDMSNLGEMSYFLGLEIKQCGNGIFLSQKKYAQDMMKKFNMGYSKPISTPLVLNCKMSKNDGSAYVDASWYRSIIGSLLYLTATRPDIMFVASLLSRYMSSPTQVQLSVAKRVLKYVNGTIDYGIWFIKNDHGCLLGYSDSDWAGSIDDDISTFGYLFQFGSGVFCWNSCKQEVVAQSTIEAKFISALEASNHAIWLRKMLSDMGQPQFDPSLIYVDNTSAIAIAQNPMQHKRTKHVHVKYHVIRQYIKNKQIQLLHYSSDVQLADILIKSLPKQRFEMLREQLGVTRLALKEEC
ncbi:hypothetical protein SLEP1_g47623 [Rubroshorea leprosula]|uniref:Retrovirus-related Pol polyprotein from transposon TNT 1-94 n=1 Tax=Rubroshorea leprosula TaxID=152421 RepID=A0AAV5LS17_9ROSI|nr:hypothetical protein SLEP1_g47623 [Rubroshorea leprosula]